MPQRKPITNYAIAPPPTHPIRWMYLELILKFFEKIHFVFAINDAERCEANNV
jgi:hypothetical protein